MAEYCLLGFVDVHNPACREVDDDGVNGYLCQPRNVPDLAAKMSLMLSLSAEQRTVMGLCGRA